jgi:hypothetical protein
MGAGRRMTKLAAYSTDWSSEPVPDPQKSALTGRQEFIPGKKLYTFGGTMMYRLAMPTMELGKHGYESFLSFQIDVAPDGHIRVMDTEGTWHDDVDILVLQRHMGQGIDEVIRRARSTSQIVINDLDDSFQWLPSSNIARDTTDPIKHPTFNRDHYYKNIAASSAVTVSTPELYKEVERLGVPVYLCRNVIDIERWPVLDPGTDGYIGWIGGIQWRASDLQQLKPFLGDFLEDYGIGFYHGGDSEVPGVPKAWDLAGVDPTVVQCLSAPLCHVSKYPGLFEPLNISLIPLEICRFNAAKSSLKALESSAAGLPYIASDLPEQRWFTEDGGAGRIVRKNLPKYWEAHLTELLDPDLRRAEGAINRAHAEQFDIRDKWTQWDDAYKDIT